MTTPSAFFSMEVQSLILLYVWIVIMCALNQQQMHELTWCFLTNYFLLTDTPNTTKQTLICSAKEGTEDGLDTSLCFSELQHRLGKKGVSAIHTDKQ